VRNDYGFGIIPSSAEKAVEKSHGLVSDKKLLDRSDPPVGAVYDRAQYMGWRSETSCAVIDRAYSGIANPNRKFLKS